jgi:hypothetical protein
LEWLKDATSSPYWTWGKKEADTLKMCINYQIRKLMILELFGRSPASNVREGREYSEVEVQYFIDRKDKEGEDGIYFWETDNMPDDVQMRVYGDTRITDRTKKKAVASLVQTKALTKNSTGVDEE